MPKQLEFGDFASANKTLDAISLTEIDENQLRQQIRRGFWTIVISLGVAVAAIAFLAKGQLVSGAMLDLLLLILVASLSLFVVGLATSLGPMMSAFLLERLKGAKKSLEAAEAMEERQALAEICLEFMQVTGESRLRIIDQHEADIRSLAEAGEAVST